MATPCGRFDDFLYLGPAEPRYVGEMRPLRRPQETLYPPRRIAVFDSCYPLGYELLPFGFTSEIVALKPFINEPLISASPFR